jgi:hypothetical protein
MKYLEPFDSSFILLKIKEESINEDRISPKNGNIITFSIEVGTFLSLKTTLLIFNFSQDLLIISETLNILKYFPCS